MPPRKRTDSTSAQNNFEENVDRWVHESASTLRGRDDQPYNGVLGTLPGWLPANFQREFKEARNRLLDAEKYTPNKVHDLIATELRRDRKAIRNPTKAVSYDGFLWPLSVRRDVRTLASFRTAVRLGKEKGLVFLTGQSHANKVKKGEQYGKHQSRIAQNPRGRLEDEGATMNEVIGHLAKGRPDESAKELWPHFYSKLDEHSLNPKEDHQKGVIEYDFKSKRKTITFGTFEKVVSQYRTGRKKLP